MLNRRTLIATAAMAPLARAVSAQELGDDGLHKQPFFYDSFLDMNEDLTDAAAQGKSLLILYEQLGCPYCRELHQVNYAIPEITDYQEANFLTVQLNLRGDRLVTDFDGEEISEKALTQKWFVNFTPTIVFFPFDKVGATNFREAEGFRLPGYFKPFHYASALEYIATSAYDEQGFQNFTSARFVRLEAEGKNPSLWD